MKERLGDRIDMVARNLVSSLDTTDAAVLDLADRVAALEERLSPTCSGNPDVPLAPERGSNPNLRDRIAAILSDTLVADDSIVKLKYGDHGTSQIVVNCNPLADAVIRELVTAEWIRPDWEDDDV